jgi:exopolysaccharide biosynthesis polyprenyl glycosylphosphotransferase
VAVPVAIEPPRPADPVDFDQLSAQLAARVQEAELAERLRARRQPVRWPRMVARLAIDAALLQVAFVLAYWARYEAQFFIEAWVYHTLDEFWILDGLFTVVALGVFYARGVYSQPRGASWIDQIARIGTAAVIAVSGVILTSLLFTPMVPSRLFFADLVLAVVLVFGAERWGAKQFRRWLWQRGINEYRVAVIGATVAGQRVMRHITSRPDMGYRLVGYLDDRAVERRWEVPFAARLRPRRLGAIKDLEEIIATEHIDEVIIALSSTRRVDLSRLLEHLNTQRVNYRLLPDLMELRFDHCDIEALDGIPLIGLKEPALRGGRLVLKRVIDIILALIAITLSAPLMLALALAIRLEQPHGPILFRQQRAGRGGRVFTCLKFRSMRPDAAQLKAQLLAEDEASGPIFKMKNDPRVTRVGRFIRRTSLDELPQFFNILRGDMSWVGPRPPNPSEVTRYSDWHLRRLEVTPGLTGLWQVSGRSNLTFDEMVTLDLYYAENWSLLLDCKVILQTLPAVLLSRGAY